VNCAKFSNFDRLLVQICKLVRASCFELVQLRPPDPVSWLRPWIPFVPQTRSWAVARQMKIRGTAIVNCSIEKTLTVHLQSSQSNLKNELQFVAVGRRHWLNCLS